MNAWEPTPLTFLLLASVTRGYDNRTVIKGTGVLRGACTLCAEETSMDTTTLLIIILLILILFGGGYYGRGRWW